MTVADDLDVFDSLFVHDVRIVCQDDEICQLARCGGSFDRFFVRVKRAIDGVDLHSFVYADSLVGSHVSPFQPVRVTMP